MSRGQLFLTRFLFQGLTTLFLAGGLTPFAFAEFSARVAVIKSRTLPPYEQATEGIKKTFEEKNIKTDFDFYNVEGDIQQGEEISKEIISKNTDIVFTVGTEAFQAISPHIRDIPIVTAMLVDPEEEGVAKRGENIYGAYLKVPYPERFQRIKKMMPAWKSIAVIYMNREEEDIPKMSSAAQDAGLALFPIKIESIQEFLPVLEQANRQSQALMMVLNNEIYNSTTSKELLLFSARNKYPIIAFAPNYVRSGALLSLSSDFIENGKRAGVLGVELLKKTSVREKFVPTGKVWVAWNAQVASAFGIEISNDSLSEVNERL